MRRPTIGRQRVNLTVGHFFVRYDFRGRMEIGQFKRVLKSYNKAPSGGLNIRRRSEFSGYDAPPELALELAFIVGLVL
jgi:hypothetical protein